MDDELRRERHRLSPGWLFMVDGIRNLEGRALQPGHQYFLSSLFHDNRQLPAWPDFGAGWQCLGLHVQSQSYRTYEAGRSCDLIRFTATQFQTFRNYDCAG